MDPASFESFKKQLSKESFSDGKFGVVKTFTERHYFYGGQVAESLKLFKFNSDQVKFLETVEPRMMPLTGLEGKDIVLCFVHANDRLKAVKIIADHINDPNNKYAVLDAISFHFDREKARTILDEAVFKPTCPPSCPPSCPPPATTCAPPGPPGCPPSQYPAGPYPAQYPAQYPGHPGPPGGQYPGQYLPQSQYPSGPPGQYPGHPGPPGQYPPQSQYPTGPPGQYQYPPPPGQYPYPPTAQYPPPGGQYPSYPGPPGPPGAYPPR